ncbi:TetR/AcrR family transcriptional regulator [Sphingomonas sp.]|uniref:TetR/AcrR family transcriptional regulator n=1 Tax=Sphingomonas sp. TaxID=28214 RepID=UPI00286E1134|nr:TetR/AcrR family transcriptional regulator [Sphingomonas sp.]
MPDRRPRKTDEAIRAAFLRLLFSVRYDTIGMSRIAAEADISRSTLYQHYATREHVLQATMRHIIDALADALTGISDAQGIAPTLTHFWDNRRLSRAVFGPPVDAHVRRWLSESIEQRLVSAGRSMTAARIAAIPAAAGAIALLEQWMSGHLDAPRAQIAAALVGRAG